MESNHELNNKLILVILHKGQKQRKVLKVIRGRRRRMREESKLFRIMVWSRAESKRAVNC